MRCLEQFLFLFDTCLDLREYKLEITKRNQGMTVSRGMKTAAAIYSYFEKGCRKKVHTTNPKGNMGYDQYTVPDTVSVEPAFVAFL